MLRDDATDASYRGRRVCVTGGAGFIGSHLVDALVAAGAEVSVIDDLSTGLESNLDAVSGRVRLVRGSILDPDALAAAVGSAEIVFHQAAVASVPRSVREPDRFFDVNANGTLRVLEAARAASSRRVVYAASSSVYGDQPGLPRVETLPPDPGSPYAAAKATGEALVRAWAHCYGLSTVSLRYFNIFGPRQRTDSPYAAVIPVFVAALRAGGAPVIYGDGEQTRDFTHVDNAVRANLLAGACDHALRGEAINVATGSPVSVRTLLETVAGHLGVDARCEHAPTRPGEVRHSGASIAVARDLLGYEPHTTFEEGLARTVRWYAELGAGGARAARREPGP